MLAPASVACIPRQLLPLLAVRPSSIQRLGSSVAIQVASRTAHAGTQATPQSFEFKA